MNQIIDLLGQRYSDLRASSAIAQNMPEAESIGDQNYVLLTEHGISLVLPDTERVGVIQLHRAGHEGFSEYQGAMPGNVSFAMSRAEVRNLLGTPYLHGEKQAIPVLGEKPAWDSYLLDGVRMHIEYTRTAESVQLISLTSL